MQINSLGAQGIHIPQFNRASFSKIKENFEKLGSALGAGNLPDAQSALSELQKIAPKAPANSPISSKLDALNKAVESGDTEAAQKAFAEIKSMMAEKSAMRPSRGGGLPGGGMPKASGSSGALESSTSSQTYDVKDLNRDGEVSATEELAYNQGQLETASQKMSARTSRSFDVLA